MTSTEIKQAMTNCNPVKYNGAEYDRISAYVLRSKVLHNGEVQIYKELEIIDSKAKNCVLVVDPKDVEMIL